MATLHVKSPNGNTYNMTIVTSGVTESLQHNGWCKLPNGVIVQWVGTTESDAWLFAINFNTYAIALTQHVTTNGTPVAVTLINTIPLNGFNSLLFSCNAMVQVHGPLYGIAVGY